MRRGRIHGFEFNDSSWAPIALKETIVETLGRGLRWGRMLRGLAQPLASFLAAAGTTELLDLCAGAGMPAHLLSRELRAQGYPEARFLLTDILPHPSAWQDLCTKAGGGLSFIAEPVDATAIPTTLSQGRARIIINAFHHFPPTLARAILADAVRNKVGIFIAEAPVGHGFFAFLPVAFVALMVNPLCTPSRRLEKILLTWVTPLALLAGAWDALISSMRMYSREEFMALVKDVGGDYEWGFGTYTFHPGGRGQYYYGYPRRAT